jgi:chromosome segregation ATPase
MAVQEVTRQIAAAEGDLRRQEAVRGALSGELERLTAGAKSLQSDNTELQARVDKLKSNVKRMKKLRAELMTSLSGLSSELKSLSGGNE